MKQTRNTKNKARRAVIYLADLESGTTLYDEMGDNEIIEEYLKSKFRDYIDKSFR